MNGWIQEKKVRTDEVNYQRKSYGMISLVALGIMLTACLIIFSREIVLSLKAYSVFRGISGSPWVGLENFKTLIASMAFGKVIRNTLVFNLLFAAMAFGIAMLIGYMITALPRRGFGRDILAILCILPVFLPAEVYSSWFIHLLGSSLFMNPGVMQFLHPLLSAIKYAGIPIMTVYILDETYEEKDFLLPLKVAGLFSLASLAFIMNSFFSLTRLIYNPLTYETMDTMDTFIFRKGMLEMNISTSSALGVIQVFISLLSVAVLFVPIKLLFSATFKGGRTRVEQESIVKKLIFSAIALVIFAAIYFLPYILRKEAFDMSKLNVPIGSPVIIYTLLSVFSAFIAAILAAIMSQGFVSMNQRVRLSAAILLAVITVLTMRPADISYYLLVKNMGMVNTVFAILVSTCFSAAAVWAMACILRTESDISAGSFALAMAGVFLIQAAIIYSNSTPPLLYLHNASISPVLTFRNMEAGMQSMANVAERASLYNAMGLYGFILSLPSLLLFLAAKTLLPKGKLISILSAGMKS